jgi:hypothetical protein
MSLAPDHHSRPSAKRMASTWTRRRGMKFFVDITDMSLVAFLADRVKIGQRTA